MSTILIDRSKVIPAGGSVAPQITTKSEISAEKADQVTILNGMGSPMIQKKEFALGSLSPTSNNNADGGAGHMMMDRGERDS